MIREAEQCPCGECKRMAAEYAKLYEKYREASAELNRLRRWHNDVARSIAPDLADRRVSLEYDISEIETIVSEALDKAKRKLVDAYAGFDAGPVADLTAMCDECRAKLFPEQEVAP